MQSDNSLPTNDECSQIISDIDDKYRQDLNRFKDLLRDHRLLFDPFKYNDETLWKIVCRRENSTAHNIHCMIVRFGEPYEVEAKHNYPAYRRIPIYYAQKKGSKNLKDYSFPILYNNKEYYNLIIKPRNRVSGVYNLILKGRGIENILSNRSFFIIRSRNGVNKFGKKKSTWVMVELEDNLEIDCRIIREYTLIAQIWAYKTILSSPTDYGLSPDISKFEKFWKRAIELKSRQLEEKADFFLPHEEEDNDYRRDQDDGSYEKDLQDELDYIRQNGGDWIDD